MSCIERKVDRSLLVPFAFVRQVQLPALAGLVKNTDHSFICGTGDYLNSEQYLGEAKVRILCGA